MSYGRKPSLHNAASYIFRIRSSDRQIYFSGIFFYDTFQYCYITFFYYVFFHLSRVFVLTISVFCNDKKTRRIHVESVDESYLERLSRFFHIIHKCIGYGAGRMSFGGVDYKTGLLIENEDILILKNRIHRDVLRLKTALFIGKRYFHCISRGNRIPAFGCFAVQGYQLFPFYFVSES